MKVAYVIDDIAAPGGAQKMAVLLAEQVANDESLTLEIVSLEKDGDAERAHRLAAAGCPVNHFPADGLFDPRRLAALRSFLRCGEFDLVHTNLVYSNTIGTLAARLAGVPSVAGLRAVYLANDRKDGLRHSIEAAIVRRFARGAMAVGPSTAESHRLRLHGVPITAIDNPVPIPRPTSPDTRHRVRAALGVPADAVLLLAVGGLRFQKGQRDLVAAMTSVSPRYPMVRLALVGDGPYAQRIADDITRLGLDGSVLMLGHRTDVGDLLEGSDIYVSGSHSEGMSNALLEAMAAGRPAVVTDVGDAAHVVGDTGLVVPPRHVEALAQAIAGIVADPSSIAALGVAARRRVIERHSVETWFRSMTAFYRDALEPVTAPEPAL